RTVESGEAAGSLVGCGETGIRAGIILRLAKRPCPPHVPKVDFVCCDFPSANRLTLHILAAVAEHEREMIAKRTKDGLAAAKARGVVLGNAKLAAANKASAIERALAPILAECQGMSGRQIAAELNARQVATPT